MKDKSASVHLGHSGQPAFSPEPLRLYFGLAASIAAMFLYRSTLSSEWQANVIISAGFADMAALAILVVAYLLAERYLPEKASGYNRWFHYLIISLLVFLTISSQTLFAKTGEYLDIHIISFVMENLGDVVGAVKSETDWVFIGISIQAMVFLSLASLRLYKGMLKNFTQVVLVLPIVLLASCKLFIEEDKVLRIEGVQPGKAAFINEIYWQLSRKEPAEQVYPLLAYWHRGMLTGLYFGSKFGKVMFEQISSKAGYIENFYTKPEFLGMGKQSPNIVLIALESFRSDAVGVYNGSANTGKSNTPYIDSLAADGVLVEHAYTTVPHTSKALVGIYCGILPILRSDIVEAEPGGMPYTCLPSLLNEAGYQTGHFQTAPAEFENRTGLLSNVGFQHQFTQKDAKGDWEKFDYISMDDRAMIKPALDWMENNQRKNTPFFASILTVVTHHPYLSHLHPTYATTLVEAHAAYTVGVKYTDEVVRELIESMKERGLDENTIFIITGDHGEAFGEHGKVMHNGVAYEEGVRVPLIIYAPDRYPRGKIVPGLRQHIDIMPTILEMVDMKYKGKLPGKSLLTDAVGHERILTSCFYTNYCLTMHDFGGNKISFYYGKKEVEIYRVDVDPHEQINIRDYTEDEDLSNLLIMAAKLKKSYQRSTHHDM